MLSCRNEKITWFDCQLHIFKQLARLGRNFEQDCTDKIFIHKSLYQNICALALPLSFKLFVTVTVLDAFEIATVAVVIPWR